MADGRRLVYWDACVFLTYINGIEHLTPTLEALLDSSAASDGDVHIYTSELSRVEVAFATTEQQRGRSDPEVERRIDALWEDSSAITLVEFHASIGRLARGLIREGLAGERNLKPQDAIHLATAQWLSDAGLRVDEFHTYDRRLLGSSGLVDFNIVEPYTPQPRLL